MLLTNWEAALPLAPRDDETPGDEEGGGCDEEKEEEEEERVKGSLRQGQSAAARSTRRKGGRRRVLKVGPKAGLAEDASGDAVSSARDRGDGRALSLTALCTRGCGRWRWWARRRQTRQCRPTPTTARPSGEEESGSLIEAQANVVKK